MKLNVFITSHIIGKEISFPIHDHFWKYHYKSELFEFRNLLLST